jgi:hypothetical protein
MTSSLRTSHIDRCSSTAEATSGNPVDSLFVPGTSTRYLDFSTGSRRLYRTYSNFWTGDFYCTSLRLQLPIYSEYVEALDDIDYSFNALLCSVMLAMLMIVDIMSNLPVDSPHIATRH